MKCPRDEPSGAFSRRHWTEKDTTLYRIAFARHEIGQRVQSGQSKWNSDWMISSHDRVLVIILGHRGGRINRSKCILRWSNWKRKCLIADKVWEPEREARENRCVDGASCRFRQGQLRGGRIILCEIKNLCTSMYTCHLFNGGTPPYVSGLHPHLSLSGLICARISFVMLRKWMKRPGFLACCERPWEMR